MDRLYTETESNEIVEQIRGVLPQAEHHATVLALQGDLGAGKTTLTKHLAKLLGVAETVVSPTFVIAKFYETAIDFDQLVHIDAYRIESLDELGPLGWEALLQQPKTLVIVEWPEKIMDALPAEKIHFAITHEGEQRRIKQL